MNLKPLILGLLLAATNAQADCARDASYGAGCGGGYKALDSRGYGDRIELTIDEYGHTSSTTRISGSDNSGDQLTVYDNSIPGLNTRDTIDYGDDYDDE